MTRACKKPALAIAVDDHVLCATGRASVPSSWILGVVLWAGKADLLIERSTMTGDTWREVIHESAVRAVGTIEQLGAVQRQAIEAVRDLHRAETEAERALGDARDAVWRKVAELAEAGIAVIPPDFDAIEAERQATQRIIDQDDDEKRPLRLEEGVFAPKADAS